MARKPKPPPKPTPQNLRFRDEIVVASPGEVVVTRAEFSRRSPEYQWGQDAKREGRPRDPKKSLAWLAGYDETPAPKRKGKK
jgi:hypothetical protein